MQDSNFMYSVMSNGIGGINAGGIEYDIIPGRGQELAFNDAKACRYLTRTYDHSKKYMEMGYLKQMLSPEGKSSGYVLTPEGRDMFSGSSIVEKWLAEQIALKESAKQQITNNDTKDML